jgi:hypothetical protein
MKRDDGTIGDDAWIIKAGNGSKLIAVDNI